MKSLYIYTLLIINVICCAQNLVPNPSFETYTACPGTQGSEIPLAFPWTAARDTSSTEYFNSCFTSTATSHNGYGVPLNIGGYQPARTGNAYAGFIFFSTGYREYCQVQLSSPLVAGKSYYTEFFVNLVNGPVVIYPPSCNNIAANFSVTKPVQIGGNILNLTSHILNPGNPVLKDTLNWIKVSGCYMAQGGEEYLTIGVFAPDAQIQMLDPNPLLIYYYLDDVLVEESTSICFSGVDELAMENAFSVFPNPASQCVNIKSETTIEQEKLNIKITDVVGKEMVVSEYKDQLTISFLEKGIYFVSILQNGHALVTKKLIKE